MSSIFAMCHWPQQYRTQHKWTTMGGSGRGDLGENSPSSPFPGSKVLSFIDFVSFIFSYNALVTNLSFPESLPQNRQPPPPFSKSWICPWPHFLLLRITTHNYTLLPITGMRHLFFRDNSAASHEGLLRFQFVTKNVAILLLGYTEQSRS